MLFILLLLALLFSTTCGIRTRVRRQWPDGGDWPVSPSGSGSGAARKGPSAAIEMLFNSLKPEDMKILPENVLDLISIQTLEQMPKANKDALPDSIKTKLGLIKHLAPESSSGNQNGCDCASETAYLLSLVVPKIVEQAKEQCDRKRRSRRIKRQWPDGQQWPVFGHKQSSRPVLDSLSGPTEPIDFVLRYLSVSKIKELPENVLNLLPVETVRKMSPEQIDALPESIRKKHGLWGRNNEASSIREASPCEVVCATESENLLNRLTPLLTERVKTENGCGGLIQD